MRAMKDSGVEWIGEIPLSWSIGKASYFFCMELGKMLQPQQVSPTDTLENYLCAANLGNNILKTDYIKQMWFTEAEKRVMSIRKGDLIVVEGGDVASSAIIEEEMQDVYYQNSLHRVRGTGEVDVRILRYLLMTAKAQGHIDLICNKATIAHFSKEKFMSLPCILAPKFEQSRIASFLDAKCVQIDAIIEKQQQVIEKLKAYKQSVITEAVTKGLDHTVPMKDSGIDYLGSIPESWNILKLRYVGTCQNGISKGGEFFGSGFPFVSYSDVYKNAELPSSVSGLIESTESEQANYSVEYGDVFFTRTSETIEEIGLTSVCMETIEKSTFAGFLIRVRPKKGIITPVFSKYYFRCDKHRLFFVKEMNLVIRASLGQELLKRMPVLLPPIVEQEAIASFLDNKCASIERVIDGRSLVISNLTAYKKSLIYEAVTGKMEV